MDFATRQEMAMLAVARAQTRDPAGKTFYGCTRYPDCDFTLWNKPLKEVCHASRI